MSEINWNSIDLGPIDAYAEAVEAGYTGTREEWLLEVGSVKENAEAAEDSAEAAEDSAEAAAGSATSAAASAAEAAQYTSTAVHTWLENNIDPDSGYALDRTLSEPLEAAPADLVGDLKSAINELAGHDFFAFDKTIYPNTGTQYLFNAKGLNAGFFVVYFDSYDFTGGGFTFDIKYSDNTHSYPAFNASSNKTKYTAKSNTTITEIAVNTTTSSMTAQSSAKGMIIIDAELSEDTLYRLKDAEDNIVSLQREEAVLDQNVEYYAISGKLEYTTFVQGKRAAVSPSTVIADSTRCTAGRLFHLYPGDSLKVSNIANGHKVAIASNTGYDSGWKTTDFTFTTSAELYAFVNEAASNGTDSILPSSVTTKVTITDNASRITKNEQRINEVNADLKDRIEMLYGHKYIIFDKTINPNTGTQYLFNQKGLNIDYFYVYLIDYDFTGGGFTFDIKYSDGTHSYPGFSASSNKQKYSAKTDTKITEIAVTSATQYLTQDSYAKGIIVLDAELAKDTLYRIEELEGKVNNLDAVNSPIMGAMSKNVLSLGLQASYRTVIVGLGETGSFLYNLNRS